MIIKKTAFVTAFLSMLLLHSFTKALMLPECEYIHQGVLHKKKDGYCPMALFRKATFKLRGKLYLKQESA